MDKPDDKLAADKDDAAIIAECAKRLEVAITMDSENRRDALDDLAFLKGEQWDPIIKAQRARDGRPCLTTNKLPTFLHQVTNSQRQNVPSIKIHPVSDEDMKVAEVVQGAVRHIEYKSNADVAYDTAINSAAAIGFGYFRLITDYCEEASFDQEILFQRIRNPFTVYLGPHVNPDGSDMTWAILTEKIPRTEFVAQYPDADPCDWNAVTGLGDNAKDWATEHDVRVAEYYRIKQTKETVVLLSNGESGFKKDLLELPEGVSIVQERQGMRKTVQWFKLTGAEIIDQADIPCKWIPVFPVYGDEIDIDGKVQRFGLIRNAKDPQRMYNFWMTSATEEVALRPKTPYIGAEGQFEGHEDEWAQANTASFPYLEYKPKALGGMLAPPPQRQPMADLPVGVMQMAMHANDDIKATTGIFDASLGARSNETSGVAIARRDRQGETANYHYTDNLAITLRHVGRVIIDMWPKIYDGQRTLQIMGRDGKVTGVPINQPLPPEQQKPDPKTGAVQTMLNDMTSAKLSVTVSTGPSYDTLRQEAVEGMIQTAQSWPKLMEIAGDQVVRSMDWPMADEIADRIERTIPQEVRYDKDDPEAGPPPVPPEIQQQLQQYEAALDDAMKQIEAAQSGLDKAQLQAQTQIEVAKINADSRADVEEIKGWIQMLVAQMQPPPGLTAAATDAMAEGEATEAQPMQPQAAQQPAQAQQPQQPAQEPIDFRGILQGLAQALNPPRRKSIAIQAPSGQTYQGIVADEPDESAEQ
jgi:hypothetical protein